jgi:hypothetical protein
MNSGVLRAPEIIQVFYELQKEFRCSTSSRKNSGVLRAPERIQVFYELQKEFWCSTSSRKNSGVLLSGARRTPEFFLELVEHLNSFWSS